jgi:hypothetical protein
MGFLRDDMRIRAIRPVTPYPDYSSQSSSFDWFQCGEKEWICHAHGFSALIAYDEEFDAYEWTIRVEDTQRFWQSGMYRMAEEARYKIEREIKLYVVRKDIAA